MQYFEKFTLFLQSLGVPFTTQKYNSDGVEQIFIDGLDSVELYFDTKQNLIILNNEDLDFDTFKIRISELLQVKKSTVSAIDKMRNVIAWANYQNEGFNEKFKSISDIEKAYDYCQNHDTIEFLDSEFLNCMGDEEFKNVKTEVNALLGYKLIN